MRISDWSSDVCSSDLDMLGFETITFAPIAQNLVDVALLSNAEADWLDAYHAEVLAKLGADMGGEERAWLEAACAPLERTVAALAAWRRLYEQRNDVTLAEFSVQESVRVRFKEMGSA